jgi:hypothetical protein
MAQQFTMVAALHNKRHRHVRAAALEHHDIARLEVGHPLIPYAVIGTSNLGAKVKAQGRTGQRYRRAYDLQEYLFDVLYFRALP